MRPSRQVASWASCISVPTRLCPARVQYEVGERLLTEIEVRLRLDPDLAFPCFLEVLMPLPHPFVPPVDGEPTSGRERRVELHLRIAAGDQRLYVPRVECLVNSR